MMIYDKQCEETLSKWGDKAGLEREPILSWKGKPEFDIMDTKQRGLFINWFQLNWF